MYQKIYDVVEKRGRVKTGIFLNGEETGLKYLVEEDCFFFPMRRIQDWLFLAEDMYLFG